MMRPLVFDYQTDRAVTEIEDEYLFGDSLLVAPFMEENQTSRKVYLPEGKWHNLFTGRRYEGRKWHESDRKSRLPVYIKADAMEK